MEKYTINPYGELVGFTTDTNATKPNNFYLLKKFNTETELLNKIKEDWTFEGVVEYDTKQEVYKALEIWNIQKQIKNFKSELFEAIELIKTKYIAYSNYLEVEELKQRLVILENKINNTSTPLPTSDFDAGDLNKIKTLLTDIETFASNLFDGKKEKMEDFNGALVWVADATDATKIKEIEIHGVGQPVSQVKLENLNATIIKHLSDTIIEAEKKIDDALGITLSSKLVSMGQNINIIMEDEPEAEEVDITLKVEDND